MKPDSEPPGAAISPSCRKRLEALRDLKPSLFLGLTGGIASGKSTVADMMSEMGAHVIDLDRIAREAVEPETPAWRDIVSEFGRRILREDGRLDRKEISDIVFSDPERRRRLEALTHPRIFEATADRAEALVRRDRDAVIEVVVPLLVELDLQSLFYRVILVYIPASLQVERLVKRDGISTDKASAILGAQRAIDAKLEAADFVIHNEHSVQATREQVQRLWKTLKEIQHQRRETERREA